MQLLIISASHGSWSSDRVDATEVELSAAWLTIVDTTEDMLATAWSQHVADMTEHVLATEMATCNTINGIHDLASTATAVSYDEDVP